MSPGILADTQCEDAMQCTENGESQGGTLPPRSGWVERIGAAAETRWAAVALIGCVPLAALFSFNIPAVTDVALAVLALSGVAELVQKGRAGWSLPIGLAIGWAAFVLLSAIYATALDLPGRHFGSIGKTLAFGAWAVCGYQP